MGTNTVKCEMEEESLTLIDWPTLQEKKLSMSVCMRLWCHLVLYSSIFLLGLGLWIEMNWGNIPHDLDHKTENNSYSLNYSVGRPYPPVINTGPVNCDGIFIYNETATKIALEYQDIYPTIMITNTAYISMTSNCEEFISKRGYITEAISQEEEKFPIAYSILVYEGVEQTERLLRAIYRPQNYHCIHVDLKADGAVLRGLKSIARCLPNVFMSSRAIDVKWAEWSLVEAELICMEDLLQYPGWHYHINLAAQEFPLKTNLEIVQMLKVFNGSNLISGSIDRLKKYKFRYQSRYKGMKRLGLKEPPPPGITINKGSFLIVATRGFVDYVIHDNMSLVIREWAKDTFIPDEFYFSTLNSNPQLGVPGAYKGWPQTGGDQYPFLNRFTQWDKENDCYGKIIREVCIFSIQDIYKLYNRPEMFYNKFHLDYHPMALKCMEKLHYDKIREELQGHSQFNASYYKQFEFTWNHV